MDAVYVDSSVLVSFCLGDPATRRQTRGILASSGYWITSVISEIEVQAGIASQLADEPGLQYSAEQNLNRLSAHFQWIQTVPAVVKESRSLVRRYRASLGLRTLDAIHVASSLAWQRESGGGNVTFLTADKRQAAAFTAEGLVGKLLIETQ